MNFHLELRKSNCRKELKRRTGRSLDILEVRRHELTAACSPKWAPCRIRYYPGVGRIYVSGPAGQHIGWADTLADALSMNCPSLLQAKYCPETGFQTGRSQCNEKVSTDRPTHLCWRDLQPQRGPVPGGEFRRRVHRAESNAATHQGRDDLRCRGPGPVPDANGRAAAVAEGSKPVLLHAGAGGLKEGYR